MATITCGDQIKKLTDGVEQLALQLQYQVREQHDALLSQASHAGKLTAALDAVSGHMTRLEAGAERLKSQVNTPFVLLENQTRVLVRLHEVAHLLRQSGQFLQLFRQLQATAKNPTAQACVLYDLEPILGDDLLNRIEFLREERTVAISTRQRLVNLANRDLLSGLKNEKDIDREKVCNSLQIFANMQTLAKCIDDFLDGTVSDIQHSIKECFAGTDVSSMTSKKTKQPAKDSKSQARMPGKTPTLTTSQHFRTKFWTAIEWLFNEELYNCCSQVVMLQNCLTNVRQPTTASLLVTFQSMDVKKRFWKSIEELLEQSFSEAAPHIRQCLKQDLPKLLTAAQNLQAKFSQQFVFNERVTASLEAGYLEKCAINLKAPLQGTDIPTEVFALNLVEWLDDQISIRVKGLTSDSESIEPFENFKNNENFFSKRNPSMV